MTLLRIRNAAWFRQGTGALMARYLRFVWSCNRVTLEPPDLYERLQPDLPVIVTLWHGQHFLGPFMRRPEHRAAALVSWHRDADINAQAAERLGMETIRGSGDHGRRFDRKGGVRAFLAMRKALAEGCNVVVTADVPKVARIAGRGVVMLASRSGRPVYPVGIATSRRIELPSWDRSVINLPFGRSAIVLGEPVRVPRHADAAMLERCRQEVETSLNAATARAYAIVDFPREAAARA